MKKWVVKDIISKQRRVKKNNLINNLLLARGIADKLKAEDLLNTYIERFNDPFLLKDMERAVEKIDTAIRTGQKITIYGNYDVDGITSTSILYRAFKKLGVSASYYIPDRLNEGNGISKRAIDYIKLLAADLIITVDTGIASIEEVEYAKSLGMDVIITDHHECGDTIPDTIVVNPRRKDCLYPNKNLAGCGIAFKLIQALWMHYGLSGYEELADIAAIGTIAEDVELSEENRSIVKYGLAKLKNSDRCGIKALKTVSGIEGETAPYYAAYQIASRINAAGRLSDARIAVELFTTNDNDKAMQIAKYLDQKNKSRQTIGESLLNKPIAKVHGEV